MRMLYSILFVLTKLMSLAATSSLQLPLATLSLHRHRHRHQQQQEQQYHVLSSLLIQRGGGEDTSLPATTSTTSNDPFLSNNNDIVENGNNKSSIQQQSNNGVDIVSSSSEVVGTISNSNKLGPNAPPPGLLRKLFPLLPWRNVPNWLTYARCFAIPSLMILFYLPGYHIATSILFGFASYTDWLDGYLARRWDIQSSFGAFLDPVADKLMVCTALILLSGRYGPIVVIPTCIILAREISISALREWMAQKNLRNIVQVGYQGKVKTALTMISLTLLLLVQPSKTATIMFYYQSSILFKVSILLLQLSTIITITSGSVYLRAAIPYLLQN